MDQPNDPGRFPFDRRVAGLLLALLLVGDAALFVTHVLNPIVLKNPLLSLTRDGGYPEFYQYLKFIWLIALMLLLYRRTRAVGYFAWAALFGYLLADDAAGVHEVWGAVIAERVTFAVPFNLRAQDIGELTVSAIAGAVLIPLLVWSHVRSDAACRRVSRQLFMLFVLLVAFGVGVDMLHSAIKINYYVNFALGTLEDGGEMIVVSVMLWYVAAVYLSREAQPTVQATGLLRHVVHNRRRAPRALPDALPPVGAFGNP